MLRYGTCSQGISYFYLHTHIFIRNWNESLCAFDVQSCSHHQQTNTQLFTDWMSFLSPNQQSKSTEGKSITFHGLDHLISVPVFQPYVWPLKAPSSLSPVKLISVQYLHLSIRFGVCLRPSRLPCAEYVITPSRMVDDARCLYWAQMVVYWKLFEHLLRFCTTFYCSLQPTDQPTALSDKL